MVDHMVWVVLHNRSAPYSHFDNVVRVCVCVSMWLRVSVCVHVDCVWACDRACWYIFLRVCPSMCAEGTPHSHRMEQRGSLGNGGQEDRRRVSSGRQAKWLAGKEGFGNWPKHAQQWPATENMAHGLETDGALQNEEPGQWMKGNCRVVGGHCWYYLTPCSLVLLVGLMKYVTLYNTRTLISVNATVWRNKHGHILSR